jgi:hypothetical protein
MSILWDKSDLSEASGRLKCRMHYFALGIAVLANQSCCIAELCVALMKLAFRMVQPWCAK